MEFSKLNSSNIASAAWNDGTLTLTYVHGGSYRYTAVPWNVYNDLVAAESAGKFFHANIKGKGKYEYEKAPDAA
jgi:hypothetical protein